MRRRFLPLFLPLFLLLVVGLVGCGGSSKPITVSINTPAATTIDPGDAVALTVTVDNDSAGQGVTWTLTGSGCTGSACGALSGNTSTSVTYTAPSSVTTAFTVTVTAASVKTPSVTNAVTLNIPANPAITTALGALTAGQVGSAYSVTVDIAGGISPYKWTVKSGNLPTGLTLGASSGTISGTPTASGNSTFTLQVTDSGVPTALTASGQFTIEIAPASAITFTTTSLASSVLGDTYAGQVTATGGAGTLTYAVTTGSLPAGLSMAATGAITGKSTAGGTSNFTVTASDSFGDSAKQNLAITIDPAISVTTASLPSGYASTAYATTTLAATGGLGTPYTWTWAAATGSSLPAGLTLSGAGVISGTPTTGGNYSVVVTAKDSAGNTGSATLSIAIEADLTITTASLPTGYAGVVYPQTALAATGGAGSPYTWTWAAAGGSSLPGGLALSGAGVITGTPTAAGPYSVVITATDSASHKATATLAITVNAGVSVTTASLPAGVLGAVYTQTTLAATGGSGSPYTWTWAAATGSSLPGGLTFSGTGVLSGTPSTSGSYSVVITAKDSANNTGSKTFTIAVNGAVSITTTSLPTGYQGTAYISTQLTATGGAGTPYTWTWAAGSGSSLPPGLALSTSGLITGTPSTSGTYSVVITAKDSANNTAQATFAIVLHGALSITTPTTLPAGESGYPYSQQLAATGGSGTGYTWSTNVAGNTSLQSLGLALATNGQITNTIPTLASGTATFTATVTDSLSHTASTTFSIKVYAALSIATNSLTGYVGLPFTGQMAATGGDSPFTWTWSGAIPPGLSLSTSGAVTGTPATQGPYAPLVTVKDAAGFSTTQSVTITINAGVSVTTASLPSGYPGAAYTSTTLAATGGAGTPYTWTWVAAPSSSLPAGLNLSTAGTITGAPTTAGTYNVVVTAKDSASNTGSATLSIVVESKLTFTPATLPTGAVSETYPSTTLVPSGGTGSGYSFSATGLPPGLTLSTAGVLSGTPTTQGTYTSVVVTLKDSASNTSNTTLSITINASLAITTTTVPYALVGTPYSQQLTATGGTGTLVWAVIAPNNLPTHNLSLNTTGLLSGTPSGAATVGFTAQVQDSTGAKATQPLSIAIYGPLQQDPTGLPLTATSTAAYSGSIAGTGGSGNYCWTVTGLPSDGLQAPANNAPCGYIAGSLPIQGTPTSAATVSITVKLTDATTNLSVSAPYSIVVSSPAPLTLPAPNPSSLPSATVNTSYSGSISVTGGVGPSYAWTVNGQLITPAGSSVSLGDGLTATTNDNNVLSVTGTPTSTTPPASPLTFTVQVTDNHGHVSSSVTYSIAVSTTSQISGQIFLAGNNCGGVTMPPVTLTINTPSPQQTTSDSNGNYSFSNIPNGTYSITPSITGASSVFIPGAETDIVVNNGPVSGENFFAQLGYTVSGTINYSGTKTGSTYITLDNVICGGGSSGFGTGLTQAARVSSSGAYTIHGVPPGTYNVYAIMDTLNTGQPNIADPSGTSGANTTVTNADVTGAVDTLIDPTVTAPTTGPQFQAMNPANNGVVILYGAVRDNGVESVTSYDVQWSTTSTFTATFTYSFPANGTGTDIWILNNGLPNMPSTFVNGSAYYFRARGNTSAGHGPWTVYGGSTPTAVVVGSTATGSTVTGTVTIPSTVTIDAGAVLYTGFYNGNTGAVYAERITNPSNAAANPYSVVVPNATGYIQFAILDQNNNGIVDTGDVSNTDNNNNSTITISGNMTGVNTTLPGANITPTVTTQFYVNNFPGSSQQSGYNLAFKLREANKLPIAVELTGGPNVINPVDISNYCQGCGHPQFQTYMDVESDTPSVGHTYSFLVTYSDGTSETVTSAVTGWDGTNVVGGAADLPTNLSPTVTSSTTTPTFTWTYPPNASDYVYQFDLSDSNNNQIWQIPDQNSNFNGFTSAQLPQPPGLVWNDDPTESGNSPTLGALNTGQQYNWQLEVQDSYGNQVQVSWYFVP